MLEIIVIGPGRQYGNFLVGYFRPNSKEFMPLSDCLTREAGKEERERIEKEFAARHTVARNHLAALGQYKTISGFYSDSD